MDEIRNNKSIMDLYTSFIGIVQVWDKNLNWHEGQFNQVEWIVANLVNSLKAGSN